MSGNKKICNRAGCGKLTDDSTKRYCKVHLERPTTICNKYGCTRSTKESYCSIHKLTPQDKPKRVYVQPSDKDPRYHSNRWKQASEGFRKRHPVCEHCTRNLSQITDHIKPVRYGGTFWDRSNWQALCWACHNAKTAKDNQVYKAQFINSHASTLLDDTVGDASCEND